MVDPYDDAFNEPVKVIGRLLSKEEAEQEEKHGNYVTEVEGGYRRIVAAPKPQGIIEIDSIKALSDQGQVVIACGGGGIPVIEQQHAYQGASAVIEKDCIAGKLASDLMADELIILTSVDMVYKNFGKEDQEGISSMTVAEAQKYIEEGQFGATDMLPKIEAAIAYLAKKPDGQVLITSLAQTNNALKGKTGTIITA